MTPLRATTPRGLRRRAAGAALLSVFIAHAATAAPQPAAPAFLSNPDALPPRFREAMAVLADSAAPEAARLEAARALVGPTADIARSAVLAALASTVPEDQAPQFLLRALAETFNPAFRPALLAGIRPDSGWPEARRLRAIGALALDQRRDTVAALIDRLSPAEAPTVRSAATAALVRITGRDDDEPRRRGSRDAWAAWYQDKALLPENLWLAELAAGASARADRLAASRREVEAQYRAAMEQLYTASGPDERHAMLLGMLQGSLAAIRQLGLDLVERALDGSQRIDPAIARRIIELLADPSPDIRARAALLIDRMRPEGAGAPVAEALLREKDPEVAGRLLLALRNWPTPVTRDVTLQWLAFDDPAIRRRAARAILAAIDAGILARPEDQQAVVATLRKPAPDTLSAESMRLLALLGDTGDREILASLLTSADPAVRRSAASALADLPDYRPRLIDAAAGDPQLLPVLVDALAACPLAPTLADYDAIAAIIPPDAPRDDHLAVVARALSVADLLQLALRDIHTAADAAAQTTESSLPTPGPGAAFIERILARCLDDARATTGAAPRDAADLARALLLLAQVRLSLDRPDTALAAIDTIDPAWNPQLAAEVAHARCVSLLLLGRLDDPRLADATAEAWLDALDRCARRQLPHTRALHAAAARIAATFTDPQRQRFARIAATLPPEPAAEAIDAPPPAPSGGG